MAGKIHVSILDDHQSIIDGYSYRLSGYPQISIVSTLLYGEELEPALAKHAVDVLLLDINVPTSPENTNPYPILHLIPKLLQQYPRLNILVISMYAERSLIRAVMESGASGYVLKDDQAAIRDLGNIVLSIAGGGIYFSQKAYQLLQTHKEAASAERLTARQQEVLSLCAAYPNHTTEELGRMMNISNSTVRNLLSSAYLRLNVRTRAAAIDRARQLGLITPLSPPYNSK